jgi:hypothetical protein
MMSPLRLLWLISLPVEASVGWLLINPSLWRIVLPLHMVASVIFGFSLIVRADDRINWSWSVLGWALSLLLFPVVGMLTAAVAFVLAHADFRGPGRTTAKLGKIAVEMEEATEDVIAQAREMEISVIEEREVEPVVDVLQEADPESKRAAIEAIARQRNAGTIRLLMGLLHDPSPEARFFASISLSKLEDEISKAILSAQRELAANPDLPGAHGQLARLYLDYVLSGFLEGAPRDYYLGLTRRALEKALEASPHSDQLTSDLARVHLMLGDIANASVMLEDLVRTRPGDPNVHLARMEIIYEFGDFRELSVYARRAIQKVLGKDAESRELIDWWAGIDVEEAPSAS